MKYKTKNEAAHAFVSEFDAIRQDMIAALMDYDEFSWDEVTMPCVGDRVSVFDSEYNDQEGEVVNIIDDEDGTHYQVKYDDGRLDDVDESSMDVLRDDRLPMWGTMWSFSDPCDIHWIEEQDGVKVMSELGFRIYHHDEWGYFFGIDAAGFDFYEAYWIPLYNARGLRWHEI